VNCQICNKNIGIKGFSSHLRTHKILSKEYYDKYLKKENEGICLECGKKTKFNRPSKGYSKFCSLKCSANSNYKKEKIKKTNLEKYGVENPGQNEEIKEKIKKTNIEKYGVKWTSQNKEIREKQKETCLKKYGYKYSFQNREIRNKIIRTRKNNYLENGYSCSVIKWKYSYFNNKIKNLLNCLNIEFSDDNYIDSLYIHNWKCLKCNNIFQQKWKYIQRGFQCPICFPKNHGISNGEKELFNFIESIELLEINENCRNIISPYELDIYIPSKNIAIEFDGLYWHSEEYKKNKNYHLNKTKLCEKQNIRLIHIFEDEWIFKKDIVKSRLKQILNVNNLKKIHARKCQIKEISLKVKNEFLNKYHIQGEDRSSIKLGAFHENELISVITFSKESKNIKDVYELNRFCSNYNYHIFGIASKMLTHFKNNYQWKEIFSYADRRWSQGNLYKKIGFELDSVTESNYWYIRNHDYIRIHRFNLRKRPEEPKDIPEWILRSKEGYNRIWDCGHYKFKMENNL